jgi:hypothetical protein
VGASPYAQIDQERLQGQPNPVKLPGSVDFVSACVVAKHDLHLSTCTVDGHLTRETLALLDHRVPAVVACHRRNLVRAVAIDRVAENLLHTSFCLAHVEHHAPDVPEKPQRNDQHHDFEGDNREASPDESPASRPFRLNSWR